MPKNLLDCALRGIEESNYNVTNVRGYNHHAVIYVRDNSKEIKSKYKSETVIAVNGDEGKIVAHGRTMEGVLSAVGGLEEIQFPNTEHVMVGKVKDILLAGRRFDKHLDFLGTLPHYARSL